MKVLKAVDYLKFEIEDRDVPELLPQTAIARLLLFGVCTTDILKWYVKKKVPAVLGHEVVGEIVEIDKKFKNLKVGDRVFYHHHAPCGFCENCLKKNYTLCKEWEKNSLYPGAMSEYTRIGKYSLLNDTLKIPKNLKNEEAIFIEPFACSLRAAKKGKANPSKKFLQIGLGLNGLLNCLAFKSYGVNKILGLDLDPIRVNLAKNLNICEAFVSDKNIKEKIKEFFGGLPDIVLVGPHSREAIQFGLEILGEGGTLILYTPSEPELKIPVSPKDLYFKDQTITCSYSCDPYDTRDSLRIILSKFYPFENLITHKFKLEEAEKAFEILARGGNVLKIVLEP
ncbi:MAG: alcohol dehydrogenase catalytic domain-containing protein [Thermoanaerobaculia bacterium]